jgi:hypothetical protein
VKGVTIWRSWTPNGKVQQVLRMLQQGTKALKKSVQFQFWQSQVMMCLL